MRLFVAVEIPESVRAALSNAASAWAAAGASAVKKEGMHFTLAFMGSAAEEEVALIEKAMDSASIPDAEILVQGIGAFGNPGAVFGKVGRGSGALIDAAASLRACLAARKVGLDGKEFVPHVTIARIKRAIPEETFNRLIAGASDTRFGAFGLQGIVLFGSELGPGGARYSKLYERKR